VKLQADRIELTQKSKTFNTFELAGHARFIAQEGGKITREVSADSIKIEWLSADGAIVFPKPFDAALLKDILTPPPPK
jgi:hypothetical protein